ALDHLTTQSDRQLDSAISASLEFGFAVDDPNHLVKYISLANRWQPAAVSKSLWALIEHKSKPVRLAAARALAKIGDAAVVKAGELLAAKKAATRSAAVTLLATAETPAAVKLLEARVDEEP